MSPVLKGRGPAWSQTRRNVCQTVKRAFGWLCSVCDFKVNKPSLKKKNPEISCPGECNLVFPSIYSILTDKHAGRGRGGSYAGPGVTKNQIHLLAPHHPCLECIWKTALRNPQKIDLIYLKIDLCRSRIVSSSSQIKSRW